MFIQQVIRPVQTGFCETKSTPVTKVRLQAQVSQVLRGNKFSYLVDRGVQHWPYRLKTSEGMGCTADGAYTEHLSRPLFLTLFYESK